MRFRGIMVFYQDTGLVFLFFIGIFGDNGTLERI